MGPARGGGLMQAGRAAITFLSLGATVLVAPRFWWMVDDWVWRELLQTYDPNTARILFDLMRYASFPLVFFALQMGIFLALWVIPLIVIRFTV